MSTSTLSPHVVDTINRIDLPRLLEANNVNLTWRGSRPWASCWMHQDDSPSVQLNDPTRSTKGRWTYYCYGCGEARGDALEAAKTIRHLSTSDAIDYLERFVGTHPAPSVPVAPAITHGVHPEAMSRQDQELAAGAWIEALLCIAPHASSRAREYLIARGSSSEAIDQVGGGWLVTRAEWGDLARDLQRHPHLKLLTTAGLVVAGRDGRPRPLWFDDTVLCASRARNQKPLYFWGRRLKSSEYLTEMRYLNQKVGGARHIPFGLDAVALAAQQGSVLRMVEGPITCLGARSLIDGNARPTCAMLHRLGWGRHPDPRHLNVLTTLLDDLRRCQAVEICPDNDSKPSTCDQGISMGVNLVTWLRMQGVKATLRTFQDYNGPVAVPKGMMGVCLGYPQKDFADVAQGQRHGAS